MLAKVTKQHSVTLTDTTGLDSVPVAIGHSVSVPLRSGWERMGTTQSVISRIEEGSGAKNRLDTLARIAEAFDRHLIVSFPEKVPTRLKDAVQLA